MRIDLRSDTVTRPSTAMLDAMMSAEVGDDVFNEDPTVRRLEEKCASLFNMDAALYCPSGTMTNQIGINVLSQPYEEVICYKGAHIYKYEGGGVAGTSGLSFRLLEGDRGRLSAEEILENINPEDIHAPRTTIVELENTVNKAGGSYYTLEQIEKIAEVCQNKSLRLHLDGARLFNALVETGDPAGKYGKYFDTISVCLSKGPGAPVGSVLIGKKEFIYQAKRVRKFMGGGMRQAGYLAAAGLFALENNIDRLTDDHRRARAIGEVLQPLTFIEEVLPVDTNIVIFKLTAGLTAEKFLKKLAEKNILAVPIGPREIRFVTHLDFTDDMLDSTVEKLKQLNF